MTFGYARISTPQQNLEMQLDALKAFEIQDENLFTDVASGAKEKRKGLETMLMKLRKGDTVIVWKSCRLARNVKHMLSLMEIFKELGVEFKSIQEPFLDTNSPHGNLIFNIFASINQMEREVNRERVIHGLNAARKRGKVGGRPKGLSKRMKQLAPVVASMWKDEDNSISLITSTLGISQGSVYRCLEDQGIDIKKYKHKNVGNQNAKQKIELK